MRKEKKYFCGIDPGKTGAIACIDDGLHIVTLVDYDENPCGMFVDSFRTIAQMKTIVYLEKVHSMPRQGVVSTFNFGQSYGFVRGLLSANGINFVDISPQAWQKGLVTKTEDVKKPSLELARKLFSDTRLSRQKDHNRADALIIAYRAYLDYEEGKTHA